MRKLAVLSALLVIVALPAMAADNYHYNANMNCSDCHSMHASAHNNLDTGAAITSPNTTPGSAINPYYPAASTPQAKLLKADDVCASCHKGQTFAPDVFAAGNGYVRSAGGLREGTTGGGHRIGSTKAAPGYNDVIPGYFTAGTTLECTSCHSPHGGTNYRNLVPYGMKSNSDGTPRAGYNSVMAPTVEKGAFTGSADVTIVGADTYVFGTTPFSNYYGRSNITYSRAATAYVYGGGTSSNRIDQFCGVCHGAFHGGDAVLDTNTVGNGSDFVRHPTGVVLIGSWGRNSGSAPSNLKVYQAAATANPATDSPGCLTCHKAHGNNNPFALVYPSWTAADTTEEGGGEYKSLCKSCHGMGGSLP